MLVMMDEGNRISCRRTCLCSECCKGFIAEFVEGAALEVTSRGLESCLHMCCCWGEVHHTLSLL